MIQALKIIGTGLLSRVHWHFLGKRSFSCSATNWTPVKVYKNAKTLKKLIMIENRGKSGIYRWTNLLNGKSYLGSSFNLSQRFSYYYSSIKKHMETTLKIGKSAIYSSIIKYGISKFNSFAGDSWILCCIRVITKRGLLL
jgi:hypothetical protein